MQFYVWGDLALFTEPVSRGNGKQSYDIPTYSALRGIAEQIYWKPTINYVIDRAKVVKEIRHTNIGQLPLISGRVDVHSPMMYDYLEDVGYAVQLHMEANPERKDLWHDFNLKKHETMFEKSLQAGGRRPSCLGVTEARSYVRPIDYDAVKSFYEGTNINFGPMVHSINYMTKKVKMFSPVMIDGEINFPYPDTIKKEVEQ